MVSGGMYQQISGHEGQMECMGISLCLALPCDLQAWPVCVCSHVVPFGCRYPLPLPPTRMLSSGWAHMRTQWLVTTDPLPLASPIPQDTAQAPVSFLVHCLCSQPVPATLRPAWAHEVPHTSLHMSTGSPQGQSGPDSARTPLPKGPYPEQNP